MHDPNWQTKFDAWKRQIDRIIAKRLSLVSDDLPDCPYADWYDQGVKPAAAASKAIKNAKNY